MREYEIIDIAGASCSEFTDTILFSGYFYKTAKCEIYVQKFFDGDTRMATINLCTMECSVNQHISINKVTDNLVACNEDLIPYMYK